LPIFIVEALLRPLQYLICPFDVQNLPRSLGVFIFGFKSNYQICRKFILKR
jgi:hypothetical protein